jgi:hypothetical protein
LPREQVLLHLWEQGALLHSSLLLEKRWMAHCKRTTHEKRPQVLLTDLL